MTFWGTEVKPGKPFTHKANDSKGRLHISMATLGFGANPAKSVLQCNVGDKSPVYLCSLYPRTNESLQLHLEFDEVTDVVFSVIGPRSIHLSGYYLGSGRHSILNSDSESYGEDIAESETQRTDDSEDEYEDSFIDDGDLEMFLPSSISNSDDQASDIKKPRKGKRCGRRLRKKCIVSESDEEPSSRQKDANCSSCVPLVESKDDNKVPFSSIFKSKTSSKKVEQKEEEVDTKASSKKTEDGGNQDTGLQRKNDGVVNGQTKRQYDLPIQPLPPPELGYENGGILDEKSREWSMEGKSQQGNKEADHMAQYMNLEDEWQQKATNNDVGTENNERPKKKRKKQKKEVKTFEDDGVQHENIVKDNKSLQDDGIKADESQFKEKNTKKKKKKNKTKENQEAANSDVPLLSAEKLNSSPMEIESEHAGTSKVRTLSNGLVIEQIEPGNPDGKIASSGKKIIISSIGKLKNGEVIESTIGSSPYKFRLGAGKVIEGLEVGIDGMRVGEKRRLTIPPSLGSVRKGDGKNTPPNSWLVYDIELIKVRR